VAGRRESYRPIQSQVVRSSEPLTVARAFREHFGFDQLYVADLDAIMSDQPQWSVLKALTADGFRLLVDAGIRDAARGAELLTRGVSHVVAGLETLPGPHALTDLIAHVGGERVVFSLDLYDGRPLGRSAAWESADPQAIAGMAIGIGITSLILLDLAAVGVGSGVPTHALCRQIRSAHPQVKLISGGGVRGVSDLREIEQAGGDVVLIASALHDGRIGRAEIASIAGATAS
ncbi:MAG: hypothetical protein KF861_20925, partial [Planctomycetaceae bacterium]|nr:hypothetical protein [Planctomycetaceae bacterium]